MQVPGQAPPRSRSLNASFPHANVARATAELLSGFPGQNLRGHAASPGLRDSFPHADVARATAELLEQFPGEIKGNAMNAASATFRSQTPTTRGGYAATSDKWSATGRKATGPDGIARALYRNPRFPGEARVRRMRKGRNGKVTATYVRPPKLARSV